LAKNIVAGVVFVLKRSHSSSGFTPGRPHNP
jgi:hypothetical protein